MTDSEDGIDFESTLAEGVRLFNSGRFFEAHEVLEEIWRPAAGGTKQFLKGLIHAAVALYQYERRNLAAARSKHASTHYYLDPVGPACAGIDIEDLLRQMDDYFESLLNEEPPRWRDAGYPRPEVHGV
jgi:predicted metal-dependent hydrolase